CNDVLCRLNCSAVLLWTSPRPPRSTRFPYTTLFRSDWKGARSYIQVHATGEKGSDISRWRAWKYHKNKQALSDVFRQSVAVPGRSEEHTSELQSRENLVCRLLLEKKKHEVSTMRTNR